MTVAKKKKDPVLAQFCYKAPSPGLFIRITMRAKWIQWSISILTIAGVYWPESGSIYALSQEDIILHLTGTVHQLYKKYSKPPFHFHDLDIYEVCDDGDLKQTVKVPTKKKIPHNI